MSPAQAQLAMPPAPRPRRAPAGFIRMAPSAKLATAEVDWSAWYLTEDDDMPQPTIQGIVSAHFFATVAFWLRRTGRPAFVGLDTFFAWVESEPNVRVSPDVYVLLDPPADRPSMWTTWQAPHKAPDFALEIVSDAKGKEYEINPEKYASLGVRELVIYDPDPVERLWRGNRVAPLQRWVRGGDGSLSCVDSGVDRVWSETLGVWLIATTTDGQPDLRLARDRAGQDLLPTPEEAEAKERLEKEYERAEKERERAARVAAESELAELRAQIAASKLAGRG